MGVPDASQTPSDPSADPTQSSFGPGITDWSKVQLKFNKHKPSSSSPSSPSKSKKAPAWKNLKQILSAEAGLPWPEGAVHYAAADAHTSFLPAAKYSDVSGLEAKYTDPHSKLRYANAEEYAAVKAMPSDIVAGYLTLRRANTQLQ